MRQKIKDGRLVQIGYGLYAKAERSPFAGKPAPVVSIRRLASEALRRLGKTVVRSSFEEAYNQGRSTQVPTGRTLAVKDRVRRKIGYDGNYVVLERARQSAPGPRRGRSRGPAETAADKLSAFAWRVLVGERGEDRDDPAIVRHIHDLAALEHLAAWHAAFPGLLRDLIVEDRTAARRASPNSSPGRASRPWRNPFAGDTAVPRFSDAAAALERLCALLAD